jgi:hypothetical protein
MSLGAPVGHGGALVALDRGSEAAGSADDGEQWQRRRSGKARGREREMVVKLWVQEQKRGCIWSSRRALSY